jgi:hypothetical protein
MFGQNPAKKRARNESPKLIITRSVSEGPGKSPSLTPRVGKGEPQVNPFLRNDSVDDMTMHVGQTSVNSVLPVCQLFVIKAQQVQDGGIEVVD